MGLGPLLPGRIPGSLQSARLTQTIQSNQQLLTHLQNQVATNQRYFVGSEDPAAASRAISLQSLLERKTQFSTNVSTNQSLLNASDTAIGSISDALNRAKQLASGGIGASSSPEEKEALAAEALSLVRQVVNTGNTSFRGRYLFGGSQAATAPFTLLSDSVRYGGDTRQIQTYLDLNSTVTNNVDGNTAIGGLTSPISADVNPAATLQTRVRDLFGGQGVALGNISVSLSSGAQTATVDLTGADTLQDIKTRIEGSFTSGSVTVSINPANNGLRISAATGTVTVSDLTGNHIAVDLGISGGPAAAITGADLDPQLTLTTPLSALNGGTGIGATAGTGLRIVNGTTSVVDLSTATTIEDVFNLIQQADPDVSLGINANGNGLAIQGRSSGVDFSIGENNGTNATLLGVRTTTGSTLLSSLNHGTGVPFSSSLTLNITRRDGSVANVDLTGSVTLQDAITKINAVDPGNLVASLNTVGNGLSLADNSGTSALAVDANEVGTALGLSGAETGSNPLVPLVGRDPNPQEVIGSLNILLRLQRALSTGDNQELSRLNGLIDKELVRNANTRGEIGGRLKTLDAAQNHLEEQKIGIQEGLSEDFDTDLAEVLTQLVNQQAIFEAVLKTATQSLQLSLVNYL